MHIGNLLLIVTYAHNSKESKMAIKHLAAESKLLKAYPQIGVLKFLSLIVVYRNTYFCR